MSDKQSSPKTIRVAIVGDHPWTGHCGDIESLPSGQFHITNILGTEMLKVKLDDGHECFAGKSNLRTISDQRSKMSHLAYRVIVPYVPPMTNQ